jgi:hypothetical protein
MPCRVPSGEYSQSAARQDYEQGLAPAEIDQADEQALEYHHEPKRCRMGRSTGGRLGSRGLIQPVRALSPLGCGQVIVG